MSFFGINIAGKALQAFQDAANITSDNIANVNTPGASRQRANLRADAPITGSPFYATHGSPGTFGDGVLVASIDRVHTDSYDALFRGASSSQNYYSTQNSQLQATQSGLGEPNAGINNAYVGFQTSIQTLVNNPKGTAERNNVLSAAQGVVQQLNSASTTLQAQESQVKDQATSLISSVNSILDQIATLNGQIRASKAVGDNPNTYLDQRDHLIDQLSTYIQTQTQLQPNGSTLVTVNGLALVNDTVAYHLAPPVVGQNANGTPQFQVNFVAPPYPGASKLVPVTSGQLGGLVDLYNNKLLPYGTSIDAFASGLAYESSRLTLASYDANGVNGTSIFTPVVAQLPISAGNIKVGISDPAQVTASLATTQAGTLTVAANAANLSIDTKAALTGVAFNNPASGPLAGTLKVTVDGIAPPQVFTYNAANTASTDAFINAFNNGDATPGNTGHYGVSASFDASSQRIVFQRDPANTDLVHRKLQGNNPSTPAFTITDSNTAAGPQPAIGTTSNALLTVLGARQISGIPQDSTNAFGAQSGLGANALLTLFSRNLGAPGIQTVVPAGIPAGINTVTEPSVGAFAILNVGDTLTIDAQPNGAAPQENVTITGVNRLTGTITFSSVNIHAANWSISAAQTTTLQNFYAGIVARIGLDSATAKTGETSQSQLSANLDKVRQGISGINIDEETQNLVKFQNAYAAAAHTMSILDQILKDAINLGGGSFA